MLSDDLRKIMLALDGFEEVGILAFKFGFELRGADDVHASFGEIGQLFVDRHRRHAVPRNSLAALGFGSTAKKWNRHFRVNYTVTALTYSQPCPTLDGLQAFGAATS